jgi:hypothetical protein
MANETYVGAGLPSLLTRLRSLITTDMIADFEKLNTYAVNAGPQGMDAAQWLETVVKDRRAGLIAHAKLVQATFVSMAEAIEEAAQLMSGADGDGASSISAIEAWLTSSPDPSLLPPVVHSYVGDRTSYDTGDRGGDPRLFYGVTDTGDRVTGSDGLTIDLPDKSEAPAPDVYQEIFQDLPDQPGSSAVKDPPDFMFLSDGYVVK